MKSFTQPVLLFLLLSTASFSFAQQNLPDVYVNRTETINDFSDYNVYLISTSVAKISTLKRDAKAQDLELTFKAKDVQLSLKGKKYLKILKRKSNKNGTFQQFRSDLEENHPILFEALKQDRNLKAVYKQFNAQGINAYLANLPSIL